MAASLESTTYNESCGIEAEAAQGRPLPNQDAFTDSGHTRNDPSTFSQTMFSSEYLYRE